MLTVVLLSEVDTDHTPHTNIGSYQEYTAECNPTLAEALGIADSRNIGYVSSDLAEKVCL